MRTECRSSFEKYGETVKVVWRFDKNGGEKANEEHMDSKVATEKVEWKTEKKRGDQIVGRLRSTKDIAKNGQIGLCCRNLPVKDFGTEPSPQNMCK